VDPANREAIARHSIGEGWWYGERQAISRVNSGFRVVEKEIVTLESVIKAGKG
jgi:hypothetical protein